MIGPDPHMGLQALYTQTQTHTQKLPTGDRLQPSQEVQASPPPTNHLQMIKPRQGRYMQPEPLIFNW